MRARGSLLVGLVCACAGVPLSCANSPSPNQGMNDGGHHEKDATIDAACGIIGQVCCEPPTQCNVGAFCAPDNTCKDQHPPDIGQPCSSPSGCSSGICGYTQGIMDGAAPVPDGNGTPPPQPTGCTVGCYSTTPDCTPGWTCQQLSVGEGLCVCSWSAEICDGKDNNCDGLIDNEPEADNYCTQMDDGIPQKCVKGACVCANTCDSNCVNLGSDDKNCGKCNHACTATIERCSGGECVCAYTLCDKTNCVNTKGSDNANCGGCGVPCAYQCTEGTCGPATFASGLKKPGAIIVDGTNVYWLDEGTGHTQVQYCPLAGCPGGTPGTLAVSSAASTYESQLGALVVTTSSVYFADDGGNIEVTPIVGGTGTASLFSAEGDAFDSYVAASATEVFWANTDAETVFGCAFGTSCASATAFGSMAATEPEGIAVSGGTVYWGAYDFDTETISIQSAPVGGGAATPLCTLAGFSSEIKDILVVGGNLYFTSPGAAVHVCPLATTGGTAGVFYADKNAPTGLASDGTDLYWTEDKTDGAILKCALGSSCATATTLLSGVKSPNGIAVSATDVYFTSIPGTGALVSVFHK